MAARFADSVQEILASVDQDWQRPTLNSNSNSSSSSTDDHLDDSLNDRGLLQAAESASKAASPLGFITDDTAQIPALMQQLITHEQFKVLRAVETYLQRIDQFDEDKKSWTKRKEAAEVFGGEIPPEPATPTPPRLIVLGPGGTGKSFLIRVLVLVIRRWAQLRCLTRPSIQQGVILAAPTGVAAFNIGGSTLQSAFNLKVEKKGKGFNQRLGARQLNAL